MPERASPPEVNAAERRRWNDERWTAMWPKRERLTDTVTPFLLAAADLQPGDAVLDVGCGGGRTSLAAGAVVGPGGVVVGADISAPLLSLAEERAAETGAAHVSFVHCDVQVDRVVDREFDAAISQFGVMFFEEPVVAFRAVAGHLRPGGKLAFACWQPPHRNPWHVGPVLARYAEPPPPVPPGKSPTGPFAFGDRQRVASVLAESGFSDVSCTSHELLVDAPDDAVVDDDQLVFMGVPSEALAGARSAVDAHLARFGSGPGGRRFPIAFHIVTARWLPGR